MAFPFSRTKEPMFERREPVLITKAVPSDASALNMMDGPMWSVPSTAGIHINQATAMQATAVMACVALLAEDVAKLTPTVYRRKADGGREVAKDHFLYELLRRPNNWQTWFEFCEQMQVGLVLRGNAYAVILRDARGTPIMLVPLNPDRVALFEAPGGELFYSVSRAGLHEMAVLKDQPLLIPAEDMLHVKWLSANGLVGVSRISLAREAIGLSLAQEQLAARWAGNSAKPAGVLTTDKSLTEPAIKRIKNDWKILNEGLQNAGRTAILEQGLKWQPLAMTSADLEFIASRTFQLSEIARIFRVPPHMIGDLTRGTMNNITQQSQEYSNNTLMSYTTRWEERLAVTFGLYDADMFVDFDETRLLRADLLTRYNAFRIGRLSGWLTCNEIRLAEGLEPVEGGDEIIQPSNMLPLGSLPGDTMDGTNKPQNIDQGQGQGGAADGGGAEEAAKQ